jgi:predicted ATPase
MHPEEAAELVNRLLRAMVDTVLKFEGRIDRLLGDGVLAVFGANRTHEDDPERAVQAAMVIREEARQLGLEAAAGINTGEVYLGSMGSEQHLETTVMGPVVHLAARFLKQAEPGEILVGETTYRLTRRAFTFAPRMVTVKGLAEPVATYSAIEALRKREKTRGIEGMQAALIGRDEELAELRAALDEACRGRGQIVTLIGEAGMGKSRLVSELKQGVGVGCSVFGVRGEDIQGPTPNTKHPTPLWLEGRCQELGVRVGYSFFVDLFHGYLAARAENAALGSEEGEEAASDRESPARGLARSTNGARRTPQHVLLSALRELVEHGCLSGEQAEEIAPVLGNLLCLRFGDDRDERLRHTSPEQIRHQTFAAVQAFLIGLAKRQPLALIAEDLHWVDSQSLELIAQLMEAVEAAPLLLVCVYRPEEPQACARLAVRAAQERADRYTEIRLTELSPAQSRRLVESLLPGSALPPDVWNAILEKPHGNPLFLEETVRALIDSGLIYRDVETWRAREGSEALAVPKTIQSVILSRVDRLDRGLRGVLQCASVIGPVFRPRLLERLTPDGPRLEESLAELERHGLILPRAAGERGAEEEYTFRHVLTQETVYETILRRRRAVLHQEIAEAIETLYPERLEEFYDELARRYSLTGSLPKAIEYLLKAGQRALRLYANQEAIHYFESALRCLEQLPVDQRDRQAERTAHEGLGDVLFRTGNHAGAEVRFQMALELALDAGEREFAALRAKLADAIEWQGQPERAFALARAGLEALGEDWANPGAVRLLEVITRCCWAQEDREAEQRYADQLKANLARVPYFDAIYMSYYAIAWVEVRARRFEAGEQWLQKMEQVCREHQNESGLARCYHGLGDLWRARGDHQQASDWFAKSLIYCERPGDAHLLMEGHLERAHALILVGGDPDEIDQHLQHGLGLASEMAGTRAVSSLPVLCAMLGDAYSAQNIREKAIAYYLQALGSGTHRAPQRVLGRLERLYALECRHEEFRSFCRRAQAMAESGLSSFNSWFLTPGSHREVHSGCVWEDNFETSSLREEWQWIDPGGVSTCEVVPPEGLLMVRTPAMPGLSRALDSAPRLLRAVAGDFAAETLLVGADERESHTAGLLLWDGPGHYLFFGKRDPLVHEVRLELYQHGQRRSAGRGWLPGADLYLRLDRRGDVAMTLCSNDGRKWWSCGETAFSSSGELWIGLCAACPMPFLPVSVARFQGFRLWVPEGV